MRPVVPKGRRAAAALAVIAAAAMAFAVAGLYRNSGVSDQRATVEPSPSTATGSGPSGFIRHDEPEAVPDIAFIDGDEQPVALADLRGRTVLLNIWATWCVPCREEMPALDRLQRKLGSPQFVVVPLSIDRDGISAVRAFYGELGLEALDIYVDPSAKAPYRLGAIGIPTTLLINPDGQETGRLTGPAEWDSPELISIIEQELEKVGDESG